jgi:hypothetical protein
MNLQTWHELPAGCPSTIRIGAADFTVHANWEEITDPGDKDEVNVVGMTFSASHQIWLHIPSQSAVGIKLTLVHEILHACIGESGAREFLPSLKPKHTEEAYVSVLSSPLFGVLIDNPNLLTYLTSDAKS